VTIGDFESTLDKMAVENSQKNKTIEDFVSQVKMDCQVQHNFFNFTAIPEFVSNKKYPRKVYDEIILKILIKVRNQYLKDQAKELKVDFDKVQIDEDKWEMVPASIFDDIVSAI
jgi:hypothetical protein